MTIQGLEPYAKRKLTLGIVTLTAAEAEYICEHMAFERQRDADHKHIGNLTDQMEHDEWVGMSMLLFANHRRKLWLIDAPAPAAGTGRARPPHRKPSAQEVGRTGRPRRRRRGLRTAGYAPEAAPARTSSPKPSGSTCPPRSSGRPSARPPT